MKKVSLLIGICSLYSACVLASEKNTNEKQSLSSQDTRNDASRYGFDYKKIERHGHTYVITADSGGGMILVYSKNPTTLLNSYALNESQLRNIVSGQVMRINEIRQSLTDEQQLENLVKQLDAVIKQYQ